MSDYGGPLTADEDRADAEWSGLFDHWDDPADADTVPGFTRVDDEPEADDASEPAEPTRCGARTPLPGGVRGFRVCTELLVLGRCPECDRSTR